MAHRLGLLSAPSPMWTYGTGKEQTRAWRSFFRESAVGFVPAQQQGLDQRVGSASSMMPSRAKPVVATAALIVALATASGCSEEPELSTIGNCNQVAAGAGCLEIEAKQGFNGYVRVLALEEKGGGNLLGRFFELSGNTSIGADMKAGHYRIEGFTGSQRPKVDAAPDCSNSVEVRAGFGMATTVEPDDKDGCEVGPR